MRDLKRELEIPPSIALTKNELFDSDSALNEMKIINQIKPKQLTIFNATVDILRRNLS